MRTPASSAIAFTMKLGALPMYELAPMKTAARADRLQERGRHPRHRLRPPTPCARLKNVR